MTRVEGEGASRPRSPIGRRIIQLGLTVLVTWFILDRIGVSMADVRGLGPEWWRPDPLPLVLASAVLLGAYVVSGLLWVLMARELGAVGLGMRVGIGVYLLGNLGRYVPGKVWQVLGLAYLAGREGVDAPIATSAAVLGQALSLAGACLVGSLALLNGPAGLKGYAPWVIGAVGLGVLLTLSRSLMSGALALWSRLLKRGEAPTPPNRTFGVRWALAYALNWLLYGGAFVLFVRAFDGSGGFLPLASGFVAAYLLGYLALFAPAGIGVREGFLVAILSPLLGVGAVAVAAWSRLWLTAVEVVSALLVGAGTLRRARSAPAEGPHV